MIIFWTIKSFCLLYFAKFGHSIFRDCEISLSSASGNSINADPKFCPGDLIFEDNFNSLDFDKWEHENILTKEISGFQWYTNNRSNSFIKDGLLYIRPTLTSDYQNEEFLTSGTVDLRKGYPNEECTSLEDEECEKIGTVLNIINPVRSARLRTLKSFSFKFGKIQIRAKMPCGDWLWPSILLIPKNSVYGPFPQSGEIYMATIRGNRYLMQEGVNIGTELITSTLFYGPSSEVKPDLENFEFRSPFNEGFDKNFHIYEMEWSPEAITFKFDQSIIGYSKVGQGFWKEGNFEERDFFHNPWEKGSPAAPFDQEFYVTIGLAVGGALFFPDDAENPKQKPWKNTSPSAVTDFWKARDEWLPTWHFDKENFCESSLVVDFIRVYAL